MCNSLINSHIWSHLLRIWNGLTALIITSFQQSIHKHSRSLPTIMRFNPPVKPSDKIPVTSHQCHTDIVSAHLFVRHVVRNPRLPPSSYLSSLVPHHMLSEPRRWPLTSCCVTALWHQGSQARGNSWGGRVGDFEKRPTRRIREDRVYVRHHWSQRPAETTQENQKGGEKEWRCLFSSQFDLLSSHDNMICHLFKKFQKNFMLRS